MSDSRSNGSLVHSGAELCRAEIVWILLHGRGATAQDILGPVSEMREEGVAYLAPQAAANSWYPHSFLAPTEQNEPWLSSAIARVDSVVRFCVEEGLSRNRIIVSGFSQGACLATEYVAQHPARYGALIAFTGGLIGPPGADLHHRGSLHGTPVLLSSGDPDAHVPWARVETSASELERMGARVKLMCFPGRPHSILREEIEEARRMIFSLLQAKPGSR